MARERLNIDVEDLVERYVGGESEKALGLRYGVNRTSIRSRLVAAGIAIRGQREANVLRMRREGPEGRALLLASAHAARRGTHDPPERVLARTKVRARNNADKTWLVGAGEADLRLWLRHRGLLMTPQLAVGPYNLDLARRPIAVEVAAINNMPLHVPRWRQRSKYLAEHGWAICYVWVTDAHRLTKAAANEVIAFNKFAQGHPPAAGQYRVVRGSGEVVATGRFNLDDRA